MNAKELIYARLVKPAMTPCTFAGVDCFIKHFSELDTIEWQTYLTKLRTENIDDNLIRCKLVARCLCNEDGTLVFGADQFEEVAKFPSLEIGVLFDAILKIQKEPDDKTDELKKSSTTIPDSSSPSDLPVT